MRPALACLMSRWQAVTAVNVFPLPVAIWMRARGRPWASDRLKLLDRLVLHVP